MDKEEKVEITPYRMGRLVNLANKIVKSMNDSIISITFEEMEIVLRLIQNGIDEAREVNRKGEKGHVS